MDAGADCGARRALMRPDQRGAYRVYLDSPAWQELRKRKLQELRRCQGCGGDECLQVHHLTYERIGHERLTDLMVLCHLCHAKEHGKSPDVGPIAGPTIEELTERARLNDAILEQMRKQRHSAEIKRLRAAGASNKELRAVSSR